MLALVRSHSDPHTDALSYFNYGSKVTETFIWLHENTSNWNINVFITSNVIKQIGRLEILWEREPPNCFLSECGAWSSDLARCSVVGVNWHQWSSVYWIWHGANLNLSCPAQTSHFDTKAPKTSHFLHRVWRLSLSAPTAFILRLTKISHPVHDILLFYSYAFWRLQICLFLFITWLEILVFLCTSGQRPASCKYSLCFVGPIYWSCQLKACLSNTSLMYCPLSALHQDLPLLLLLLLQESL